MKIKFEADNMQFELDIKSLSDANILPIEQSSNNLTEEIYRIEKELASVEYEYQLASDRVSGLEKKVKILEAENEDLRRQIDLDNKAFESGFNEGYDSAKKHYSNGNIKDFEYIGGAINPNSLKEVK